MPNTKTALVVFGLGLIAGFVAVVFEIAPLELPSSIAMALGLIGLPVGLFADGRGFVLLRWIAGRLSRRERPKPRTRAKPRAPPKPRGKPAVAKTETPRPAAKPRTRTTPTRPRRKRR